MQCVVLHDLTGTLINMRNVTILPRFRALCYDYVEAMERLFWRKLSLSHFGLTMTYNCLLCTISNEAETLSFTA